MCECMCNTMHRSLESQHFINHLPVCHLMLKKHITFTAQFARQAGTMNYILPIKDLPRFMVCSYIAKSSCLAYWSLLTRPGQIICLPIMLFPIILEHSSNTKSMPTRTVLYSEIPLHSKYQISTEKHYERMARS